MKKSIAIVSDIQSNKHALDDFLNFIDKRKIQTIINLGNFLGNTIYSRETLNRVFLE